MVKNMAKLVRRNNGAGAGPLELKQPSIILTMRFHFLSFDIDFIINDYILENQSDSNLRHVVQHSCAVCEHGLVSENANVCVFSEEDIDM